MAKKRTAPAPEKKAPIIKKLVYKGFSVAQHTKSYRVMIGRNGKPVHHSAEDHLLTDKELRQMVDDYIALTERLGKPR